MPTDLTTQLRAAIAKDGRSAYQLARDSGVAQQIITRFMRGKRDVTLATAAKLAQALGVKFGE